MFNIEHPAVTGLTKVTDLIIINLLVIALTIPIITAGAAWTAMYYVTIKLVKNEESYILKDFFKSFKENFLQSTIIWIINILLIALFVINFLIMGGAAPENMTSVSIIIFIITGAILLAFVTYVYPMQAHYYNTVPRTIKNALLLAFANLPYTVLFVIVSVLPFVIALTKYGFYLIPLVFLIGLSGPAYICSIFWRKIFARLDPEVKEESVDAIHEEGFDTTEY